MKLILTIEQVRLRVEHAGNLENSLFNSQTETFSDCDPTNCLSCTEEES